LVFYKKKPTYNPQKTTGHKPVNSYTKYVKTQNNTEIYGKVKKEISGGGETDRYPRSVLTFPSDKQTSYLHPTQKPLALCEYLIKTYTNEGDLVLDNAAGSGTTGLAAKNLNRNYILIEKEEKYYNVIQERLK
jgi:site-specific DNA-methyltransferase (adenine-specific)